MKNLLLFSFLFLASAGGALAQNNARMLGTPNSQTGTTYTFVAADTTRVTTFSNANPVAVSLPNGASVGFGAGTMLSVVNLGAGSVTITCSSCLIFSLGNPTGAATLVLSQGQGADLYGGYGNSAANYVALASPAGANLVALNVANTFTAPQTFKNANNTIYGIGYGMVCDGSTDDTTSLSNAFTAATATKNAQVIIPPGTCMFTGGTLALPDNVKLQCAGRTSTTLKLKNAQNTYLLALGGTGTGQTIEDCGFDGNKANQTSQSDLILTPGGSPVIVTGLVIQRNRFANAWGRGIGIFSANGGTGGPSDILITDNEFVSNGTNSGSDLSQLFCDICILAPQRLRVIGNRFSGTGGGAFELGTHTGATPSDVVFSGNILNGVLGFGVALGGGSGSNGSNVSITGNVFNMATNIENVVDIAQWSDITIASNLIAMGTQGSGIGDLPPAFRVAVTGNRIIGAGASGISQQDCIFLGGNDLTITGNVCSTTGGPGININSATNGTPGNIVIANNDVKNSSQNTPNTQDGIALALTGTTASMTGVIVKGNRLYDDQGTKTQAFGIGIAVSGQATGFTNLTIEGNDVRGNRSGGIHTSATSPSGWLVLNNPGDTLIGTCTSAASPAVCGVSSSGTVAIANPATTIQVNTTAVTAAAKILVFEDSSLGAALGVTCNTTSGRTYMVTARSTGVSFTITASATPAANSACLNYQIIPAN